MVKRTKGIRIGLIAALAVLLIVGPGWAASTPNIVIIFTDDQGYGDVGCYGAKGFRTPHLDRLAREGMRFTEFYVAQPVCSASRAALLTGCYPNRIGIAGALGPNATHGLNPAETTLAELCQRCGYATGMVGKWHLGHRPNFLPTRHGFDSYFGLPYSNDMWPYHPEAKTGTFPKLPLLRNEQIIDDDITAEDQTQLTTRYTAEAVQFLKANREKPFFLYLAHTMPHVPLFARKESLGKSEAGIYGDVIQEIDESVGTILQTLEELKLANNTLVIFTSDNGPWLSYGPHGGSAGGLREGKGTVWEGGVRVPCIIRWPQHVPANSVCREPAMTIDLLPTIADIIGAKLPTMKIDGLNIRELIEGKPGAKSPHEVFYFYYQQNELQALRRGDWKLILPHTYRTMDGQTPGQDGKPGRYRQVALKVPELYNLKDDPSERTNRAEEQPEIVRKLLKLADAARADLGDSLTKQPGSGRRAPGQS